MSERQSETDPGPRAQADVANFLKASGKFIGWLSGSLAALSAILYALGYLVTLSNLRSLGLDFYFFDFDPSFYLIRGANFVLHFARLFFQTLFALAILAALVLAVVYVPYRFWFKQRMGDLDGKLGRHFKKHGSRWKGAALVALALILAVDLWPRFESFGKILEVSETLFDPHQSTSDPEVKRLREAVSKKDNESLDLLKRQYFFCQLFLIEAIVLFYLAWRLAAAWRLRMLIVTPFALILIMFVVSLPMIFGILMVSNKFSTVSVSTRTAAEAGQGNDLYLLTKTDQDFIIWDNERRQVVWLPVREVSRVEIGRSKRLPAQGPPKSEAKP